ncbi:single-stranded DNA-binding protein [Peptoanaerobacter stomatis]|jgi:single-stranded DNA-binding protein 3
MNQVTMIGRLTKDVELRYSSKSGTPVARFMIAVDRPYAKKEDEIQADFFNVVVWGRNGENCNKYLKKGLLVALHGSLQNNHYTDKDGIKRYNVEILATTVEFIQWAENKKETENPEEEIGQDGNFELDENGYRKLNDEDVPF